MTIPEIIVWTAVLVVGVPSAWWNPTAGALVLNWALAEYVYLKTGNSMPIFPYYVCADIMVVAIILAKAEHLRPFLSVWQQFKEILRDTYSTDRIVLLLFPVVWTLYIFPLHPFAAWWWSLAILFIAQLGAAGWEALYPRPSQYAEVGDPNDMRLMRTAANDSA